MTSFGYDVTEPPVDISTSGGPEQDAEDDQKPPFAGLEKFVNEETMKMLMNDYRRKLLQRKSKAHIDEWVSRLFDRYGRRVVGRHACTLRHRLYRADVGATPYVGVTSPCDACKK